eukprot:7956893-Pyramimonas_sp.AAC.1
MRARIWGLLSRVRFSDASDHYGPGLEDSVVSLTRSGTRADWRDSEAEAAPVHSGRPQRTRSMRAP